MNSLNLIAVLDYYLMATFVIGTIVRYRFYRNLIGIIVSAPQRWPKLLQLLRQHRTVWLAGPTLWPLAVTFLIMAIHTIAYRLVWHSAEVTPAELAHGWLALIAAVVFGGAMVYLDFQAMANVRKVDRAALEKNLDQAEFWLRSWIAPTLRVLTFGRLNPRRMVSDEVRKALLTATQDLNVMMWRWSFQIVMRLMFAATLWLTWAVRHVRPE